MFANRCGPDLVPAHASIGGCFRPRAKDRAVECEKTILPPVPRTRRAKPRANSCGALAKMQKNQRRGGSASGINIGGSMMRSETPTMARSSEDRKPGDGSYSYARKSLLQQESEAIENQGFSFGPRRNIVAEIRADYSKNHLLGKEVEGNVGVPLGDVPANERPKEANRRRVLHMERQAAEQALEWVPSVSTEAAAAKGGYGKDHSRVSHLRREDQEAANPLGGERRETGCTSNGEGGYARRSVLHREKVSANDESFPTPRGANAGFGKRSLMERECPQGDKLARA